MGGRSFLHQKLWNLKSHLARLAAGAVIFTGAYAHAGVLLDDSWTDGSRAESNLPTESAVWAGVSSTDGGSLTMTTGAIENTIGTGSRKLWTYFTSDNSAPDGNQPHNSVLHVFPGQSLTASLTFTLPVGANSSSTSKDFRFGLFFDPSNARVQVDTNSDSGGTGSPWGDAVGYNVQFPLNSSSSGTNPIQIGKRVSSSSANLNSSSGSYVYAPTGGSAFSVAANTSYTAQISLDVVSSSQLDVTGSILQGNTVLSTLTASDTGTAFGGNAIASGLLPGSQGLYLDLDQLFARLASNVEQSQINFTNFNVTLTPEPASLSLVAFAGLLIGRRKNR